VYFWKIKALKADIQDDLLTSKDDVLYLVFYSALYAALLILAIVQLYESLGISMALGQIVLFIAGVYYAFYSNGGAKGKDFSKRFFSIGWVFLIRASFFMGLGMLNLYVMTHIFGFEYLFTLKNSTIIALVFEVLFYWRIGKHISDLRVTNN